MEQAKQAMSSSSGGAEDVLRSTSGRANLQRISRLLISGGTRLLRETFDLNCKPSDLPLKLKDPAVEKSLKAASTKPQRDCLYPSPGVYGKSTDFDITLLFKLFRNMGFISPPSTGWDAPPNIADHSLAADVVRLKIERNSVYGHVNENMDIANDDFQGFWKEISETLLRIAGNISVVKKDEWQKAIQKFANDPLTPEHERCVEEVSRWYRNDMDTKKALEEVKANGQEAVCRLERVETKLQGVEATIKSETQAIKDQIGQIHQAMGMNLSANKSHPGGARLHLCISCESIAGFAADSGTSQMEETSQQHQDEFQREEALAPVTVFQPQATEARVTPGRERGFPSAQDVLNLIAVKYLYNDELSSPNAFLQYLTDVRKVLFQGVGPGSLLITVECVTLQILEELWEDVRIGHLNAMVQQLLVTPEILKELGVSEVKLKTTILEEEYNACRQYFLRSSGNVATPLCLPNNYTWDSRTKECSKTGAGRSSLYVVEDACQILRAIKGPVCVVSIAGPYRKGKSFALSEVFDQPGVFPLGSTMDAKTVGIWIWVVPEKLKDPNNGQEFTVVLLDSEGTDATEGEDSEEHRIFTLTVLLASVLIYNSSIVPSRKDVESLDFITKLSERIKFHSDYGSEATRARQDEAKFLHKTFPFFIWLLRDVTLHLPEDCKDTKDYFLKRVFKDRDSTSAGQNQKVAVSILSLFPGFDAFPLPSPTVDPELLLDIVKNKSQLNPLFLNGIEKFKSLLRPKLVPKQGFNDGEFVTGEGLASLLKQYVEVINTPGMIPNVQNAWDSFVSTKCSEARRSGLNTYYPIMTSQLSSRVPCDNETIRQNHESALKEGMALFEAETVGISVTERYLTELTKSAKISLDSWMTRNANATREACQDLLAQLKEQHLQPILAELHGEEGSNVRTDDIVNGYNKIVQDYKDCAVGAKDVRAAVLLEFEPKLMKQMAEDVSLSEKLKEIDENMVKEKLARALQDKELKRIEEDRARLQQNNRDLEQELRMVCAKNEQELKRSREQMVAALKNSEKQLENMKAAMMKEAEEERKMFHKESMVLKERVLQMQQSSAEGKRKIVHMSKLITKHEEDRKRAQMQKAEDEEIRKIKVQQEEAEEIRKKRAQETHAEEMRREQKRAQQVQADERKKEIKSKDEQKKELLDELRKLTKKTATPRKSSCETFKSDYEAFFDREDEERLAINDRVTEMQTTLDDLSKSEVEYDEVRSPLFLEAVVNGVGSAVSTVAGGLASVIRADLRSKPNVLLSEESLLKSERKTSILSSKVKEEGDLWELTEAAGFISFPPKAVTEPAEITCSLWGPRTCSPPLDENEALVSNVIELSRDGLPGLQLIRDFNEGVTLALTHSATDLKGYEVVIQQLLNTKKNEWKDLETINTWSESGIQGNPPISGLLFPLAKAKVTQCSSFAVVWRLKSFIFSSNTTLVADPVFTCIVPEYPDVSVVIPRSDLPECGDFSLTIKVQEVPCDEVKDDGLLVGPILHVSSSPDVQFLEPVTIKVPFSLREDRKEVLDLLSGQPRILLFNCGAKNPEWTEITDELETPAVLNDGVVTFQAKHFSKFFLLLLIKKRKLSSSELKHLVKTPNMPQEAGFLACLRETSPSRVLMLTLFCYPLQMKHRVSSTVSLRPKVLGQVQKNGFEKMCKEDRAFVSAMKRIKPLEDIDLENFSLRFLGDAPSERDMLVSVEGVGVPKVELMLRQEEQQEGKLMCELFFSELQGLRIIECRQNPAGSFVTPTDLSKVRRDLHPESERVYKMTANPRGLVLIINNRTFDPQAGLSERFGSERDVESVQQLFEGLHFEVHTETDLTRSRIQQVLEDFAQKDHSRFDCFVVWLMSHGNDSVIYGTDGETVQIETARNFFSNASCESLKGKPKLFFIQACRGGREDEGVVRDAPSSLPDESRPVSVQSSRPDETPTIPDQSDFMTAHAAVSGYVSYRSEKGSSYVRCLVEVFRERSGYEHLMEMLTEVTNRVSDIEHRVVQSSIQKFKQCPEQVPRLRKLLFFWPGL